MSYVALPVKFQDPKGDWLVAPTGRHPVQPVATFSGPDAQKCAEAERQRLNDIELQEILDRGQTLTRFVTRRYVSIDRAEAERHCTLDHTLPDEIQVTPNVGIVHVSSSWIYWTDEKFSTAIGWNVPRGGRLSSAAVSLIDTVWGSDTGDVEGGRKILTEVAEILERKNIAVGPSRGVYARERVEEITVQWQNGIVDTLYLHTEGYFEGYQADIYQGRESLLAALERQAS